MLGNVHLCKGLTKKRQSQFLPPLVSSKSECTLKKLEFDIQPHINIWYKSLITVLMWSSPLHWGLPCFTLFYQCLFSPSLIVACTTPQTSIIWISEYKIMRQKRQGQFRVELKNSTKTEFI